ncbi:MAG: YbfB/YjiJ family MFS transporter, partial [Acidimicrobiales bacterium]
MSNPAPGVSRPVLTACGLALGPVAALGLGRFAYSLLLPSMRADLGWTFAQAGAMNTANAVGYLLGAVVAGPLAARLGSRRPYIVGLAVTSLAILASGASGNFAILLVLRLITGASGALVFIAGAGLVARLVAEVDWGPRRQWRSGSRNSPESLETSGRSGKSVVLLGVYFGGGGPGIVLSALIVPPVVGLGAGVSWRWGWVVLGLVSLAALFGAVPAARHAPDPQVAVRPRVLGWPVRRLAPTLVAYGLFGAGYIAYVTFIVAFIKTQGFGPGSISAFWALLGLAAMVAVFAWGPVLGRLSGGRGPAVVLGVVIVGALLPLAVGGRVGDYASAVIFGGSFLTVVTAVVNLARRSLSPNQVAPAIAVLTVAFGIGQSLGPVLAGVLSDGPSGVRAGLELSVALLAGALIVALGQRAT